MLAAYLRLRFMRFVVAISSGALACAVSPGQTTPAGGQVTAGSGSIAQSGVTTTIHQETQRLAIDWTTFSSAADEAIVFNQPNAAAIALNRVTGSDPSALLGSLSANGQIFILNPNGVLFGAGSQVNVGGLVASTLSLSDADFLADKHLFSGSSVSGARTGSVVNQGHLTATPGGYIALLAPEVRNEGVITATLGTALLAAGNKLTLNIDNGSLLSYSVDQGALQSLASNQHLIQADGGQVLLTARAYDALTTAVVNNSGVIEARTLENKAGRILLLGDMVSGSVNVAGRLDASAPHGGDGGFIDTSAAHVHIADSTRVTTAASFGRTGNWLIDPADYTIAATGGDISGATLSASLAGSNVTILSSSGANTSGNGDIHVNDAVSWSANSLTLTAARDININAVMTANGASTLVLNTATANGADNGVAGGAVKVALGAGGFTGRVDFGGRSGLNILTINGNAYTIINSLGLEGSTTTTDLQGIAGDLTGFYALGANIDASATSTWNTNAGFNPIGNATTSFSGGFDGLGHTVSNLTINRPGQNDVGLFGRLDSTVIGNIGLIGGSTAGNIHVGALAGQTNGGAVSHSYATGNVSATADRSGGLIGDNNNASVSYSYATGNVSAGTDSSGGLVGYNTGGIISHSYATGDVSTQRRYVGGLVGFNDGGTLSHVSATGDVTNTAGLSAPSMTGGLVGVSTVAGTITNAYATGNVTGPDATGGLVGYNIGAISNAYATGDVHAPLFSGGLVGRSVAGSSLNNVYATGTITGGTHVGGLAGQLATSLTNGYATGSVTGTTNVGGLVGRASTGTAITNTYATGPVAGTTAVGGLIGSYAAGTITSSYWDTTTTGQATSGGLAASFGKTTAELRQASTFTGWDLATTSGSNAVWRIYEGNTAPLLRSFLTPLTLTLDYDGSGTPLADIGSVSPPGGADGGKIFATPGYTGVLTLSNSGATGSYLASTSVGGLYSNQQGYDLSSTVTRTITTTGSAAGTVRIDNPITWTNGTLILSATGSIDLNNHALTGDRLELIAGTTIANTTAAVDVNRFTLTSGTWSQINATLPVFSADDFRLTGGTFLRALGGNGTGGNPYQLTDLYGLQGVGSSSLLGSSYVLANNIDASATSSWNAGAGFAPIGNNVTAFTGTFDGLNRTVSGLTINRPSTDDIGLFGISAGTISNLGLVGGSIVGGNNVGSLAGHNHFGGFISNVYATADVSATGNEAGGLVGVNRQTITGSHATGNVTAVGYDPGGLVGANYSGTISHSYATGNAFSSGLGYAGGLVGYSDAGTIDNSYATGNASTTAAIAGGLVGALVNGGAISNSYATGDATSTDASGGLAGYNLGATITNVYATGNVTATTYGAGGLVGRNLSGSITNAYATGSVTGVDRVGGLVGESTDNITNTYATGSVTGTTNVGGLIGEYVVGTITASYWDITTTGQATSGALAASFGKTTAELRQASTFTGWDLATTGGSNAVWRIYEGNTAPLLRSFLTPLTLTLDYDGSATPLTDISSVSLPGGTDVSKIFGTPNYAGALTLSNTGAAGSYLASAPVSGLYSNQRGYDLTSTATRTITTTGSAAGTVRIDNPITWTNGTLILSATGSIDLSNRALTGDRLQLTAGTTIANTAAVDVNRFTLTAGTWSQVNATLPAFSADDFLLTGGTFLRALGGNGAGGNPYQLTDLYGLQGVASSSLLGSSFVLANTIDATATTGWNAGAGFSPIGSNATAYTGTFNGLGRTISGLFINRPAQDYIGLFGISAGTISNLGLVGGSIAGKNRVGGLAGETQFGGSIINTYATATVSARSDAGGLVGINRQAITGSHATGNVSTVRFDAGGLVGLNAGTISHSYATGNVSSANSSWAGGLVGDNDAGTIDNSYATGNVSADSRVGGLVGAARNGATITNSYATGNVSARAGAGGLVGELSASRISNSYATGAVSASSAAGGLVGEATSGSVINDAYATGAVTGTFRTGGLVGNSSANITNAYASGNVTGDTAVGGLIGQYNAGTITSSYWNNDTTGQATSGGVAASFGKTTAELRQASTFTGWDLATTGGSSAVWRIYEGNTAPLLRSFLTTLTLSNTTVTYNGTAQSGAAIATSGLLSGTSSSGRNIGSYNAFSHQQGYDLTGGTLTITPANLVITTSDVAKTYDGGLSALGTAIATSGTQLFGTDSLSGGTFAFTDKNAGTGKTVTTGGVTVNDGNGGANYLISYASNTTSTITPRSLTATATGVNKTYDGTTATTVTFGDDRVLGDVLALTGTATFANKNAATGKTVSVTGIGKTGTDAANYVLASSTTTTTASITPKALTVAGLAAENKVYDGTNVATVNTTGASFTGLVAGDTVNVSATGLFGDKNAALNKSVALTTSYTGADAANYAITGQAATTATITPKTLLVTATNDTKIADDFAYTSGNGVTYTGLVAGETASVLTGALTYNGSSQGARTPGLYTITPGGLTAANYSLTFNSGTLTISAVQKPATIMSEPYFSALRYVAGVDTRVRKRRDYESVDVVSLERAAAEATEQN